MAKVNMSTEVKVAADRLWQFMGGFNALPDWHPAVERSELENEGAVRILSLTGGGKIVEKLESRDEGERVYSYSIVDSPLPVSNYTATIRIREEGGKSVVEWSSEFDPAGASEGDSIKAIQGIYQAGFDNLRKLFGG